MKKLLTILVLALALCLLCGAALADTDYVTEFFDVTPHPTYADVTVKAGAELTLEDGTKVAISTTKYDPKTLDISQHAQQVVATVYYTDPSDGVEYHKSFVGILWPHTTGLTVVTKAPDCVKKEDGVATTYCAYCNQVMGTTAIPYATAHTWKEKVLTPNCESDGTAQLVCTKCGAEGTIYTLAMGDHDWVLKATLPECERGITGIKDASWYYECSKCGAFNDTDTTDNSKDYSKETKEGNTTTVPFTALTPADMDLLGISASYDGHDWDEWIYFAPTCESPAKRIRWCKRCDVDREEIFGVDLTAAQVMALEAPYCDWGITTAAPVWGLKLANFDVIYCEDVCGTDFWMECVNCGGKVANHTTKGTNTATETGDKAKDEILITTITVPVAGQDGKTEYSYNRYHKYDTSAAYLIKDATGKSQVPPTCLEKGFLCYKCVYETGAPTLDIANRTVTGNAHRYLKVENKDAVGHKFTDWKVKFDPMTGKNVTGWWVRTCTVCNTTEEVHAEVAPKNDCPDGKHEFAPKNPAEVKCDSDNIGLAIKCTKCTFEYTATAEKPYHVDHDYQVISVAKEATCTADGNQILKCSKCGDYKEEAIPMIAHKIEEVAKVEATCVAAGTEAAYKCSACGKLFSDKDGAVEISALTPIAPTGEHTWNDGEIVTEATCTKAGKKLFTCTVCEGTKAVAIPVIDHTVEELDEVAATCKDEGTTAGKKCSVCGKVLEGLEVIPVDPTAHKYEEEVVAEPTCTKEGKKLFTCSVCGDTYTEAIAKIDHTPVEVAEVPATCKVEGVKAGKKCSVCDEKLEGFEAIPVDENAHVWGEAEVVKAATCTEAGSEIRTCEVCGKIEKGEVAALGHSWNDGEITKEATLEEKGDMTYTCTECGETKVEEGVVEYIPVTPPKYSVEGLVYDGMSVKGKLVHDPHTVEAEELTVRVTFFMEGNYYMATIGEVEADGSFTVDGVGPIEYISLVVNGSLSVSPDKVIGLGGAELYVK